MYGQFAFVSAYHMCVWCLGKPEEDVGSLGSAELNLGPLEDQPQLFLLLLRQGLSIPGLSHIFYVAKDYLEILLLLPLVPEE